MMQGKFQGQNEIIIYASIEKIWDALIDTKLLQKWMPLVKHTDGTKECLHAVRACNVEFEGKKGNVRERCVLFNEMKEIGWEMEYDTLGFSKMFDHYGFSFELKPQTKDSVLLVNKGFYTPRNFMVQLINIFMMKKKSSGIRNMALSNLKKFIESN